MRARPLGALCGIGAYGLWGLIPLYFKTVAHVSPLEVLAHRAAWSFVVLALLVSIVGQWGELRRGVADRRTAAMLAVSSLLIAANWLVFIYAVASNQVLEASLGYFANPLVNVLLGAVLLHERLRTNQKVAIALAAVGVLVLAIRVGTLPWVAVALATTFALYGLLRKTMPMAALSGLTVETLGLTPAAVAYLGYLGWTGASAVTGPAMAGLLALSGVVTSVPLLLFAAAAQRLRLSTLGILQYLTPTLQFTLAVVVFREPFSAAQITSFAFIWTAVGVYTADALHASRLARLELVEPD